MLKTADFSIISLVGAEKFYSILMGPTASPPTPVKVVMPCCGASFEFPTARSFPKENLPCPCGKAGCWVVFYK